MNLQLKPNYITEVSIIQKMQEMTEDMVMDIDIDRIGMIEMIGV